MTSTSLDNSLSDMYHSPPRPLPYDADPRYFRVQRDGLVSRREKGSSHSHEESEPLRSDNDADSESLSATDKWNASACEEGSKEQRARSSLKLSSATSVGVGYIYTSTEDEDVCPTCLEGKAFNLTTIGLAGYSPNLSYRSSSCPPSALSYPKGHSLPNLYIAFGVDCLNYNSP